MTDRIAIVGGVYGLDNWRERGIQTPEIVLAAALRGLGQQVDEVPHSRLADRTPLAHETIHIHHVSRAAARFLALNPGRAVFTPHNQWRHSRPRRALTLALARLSGRTICLSEQEAADYRFLNRGKVAVLPNALHLRRGDAEIHLHPPQATRDLKLLYAGQLNENKRVHVLLEMLAHYPQSQRPHLEIASHVPTLRPKLEKLSRNLGVEQHVDFTGPHNSEQMHTIIRSSHLVLLPSRSEAYPTILLEALAAGIPVLGSAVGGIPELTQMQQQFLVARDADSGHLRDRVDDILSKYDQCLTLAEEVGAWALDRHDPQRVAEQHLDLYRELRDR